MNTAQFIVIPFEILSDNRLSERHIRILLALYSHRDPKSTNIVYPSKERIASLTGIAENKISSITRDLESFGWLVKTGDGGRNKSAKYAMASSVDVSRVVESVDKPAPNRDTDQKETSPKSGHKPAPNRDINQPQIGATHRIDHRIDQEYTITHGAEAQDENHGENSETSQPTTATSNKPAEPQNAPASKHTLLKNALAQLDGDISQMTKTAWGKIQKCLTDIQSVCPTVTPEEITRRANNYKLHFPNANLTSTALTSHWARCDSRPQQQELFGTHAQKPTRPLATGFIFRNT